MRKSLLGLLALLLLVSQAEPCAAQGGARAPKDEDPLAAALRLARGLEEAYNREGALGALVNAHRAAGRLEEAVRAAGAMDDGWMKARLLSRLADSCAEAGKFERAVELLSESLSVMRRAGDDQGLSQVVLSEMVVGETSFNTEDFRLRETTLKPALARLFEAGRAEEAAGVLAQVREVARGLEVDEMPLVRVLAGAARLYATADRAKAADAFAEALTFARGIDDEELKVSALCEVARAHAGAGGGKAAAALLDEAFESARALERYRERGLMDVARAYTAAGLTDKALKAAQEAREADGEDWNSSAAAVEAAAAAATGRPEDLKESLTRALARAASLEDEYGKSRALADLAASYGPRSPELLADVLWAARALEGNAGRAQALTAVGSRYAEAGRQEAALDAWGQAYEAARAVKLTKGDFDPRGSFRGDAHKLQLLSGLALKLIRAGEYGRAHEFARDMRAVQARALALTRGGSVSVREADGALATLADELTDAGQKGAALAVLAEAGDADEKPGENVEPYLRAVALAAVGSAYAKAGEKGRAAVYLRRALQLTEGIEDYGGQQKLSVLVYIGARYAEAGMTPDARAQRSLRRVVRAVEEDKE